MDGKTQEPGKAHGVGAAGGREEVDILLINPPFFQTPSDQEYSYYYPPLGLLYVAANLNRAGYKTRIYTPVCEDKHITLEEPGYPPLDAEGREAFKRKFIGYPDGPEWKKMREELSRVKPRVIGVTMATPQYDLGLLMARMLRELNPGVPVVAGGIHPSALPEETLSNPEVDVVAYGEGEVTAVELMEVFVKGSRALAGVDGIYYKDPESGEARHTPPRELIQDLDGLPFPMPDPVYAHHPRRAILTSRGCYYRCTFCAQSSILGHNVRFRSPANVVDEIEYWYKTGIRSFIIQDSTFTSKIERAMEIMDLIRERGLKINWGFQTRVDLLPRELMQKAKESGCDYIWIGVESGDPDILKAIRKGITMDQVRKAVEVIREFDIETYLYFILGFTEDTFETMRATVEFARELDCYQTSFFMFTPFPGSEAFNDLVRDDRLITRDYFYYFWLYPYLIKREDPSTDEVWEYYTGVKDQWAEKKLKDIRKRALNPSFAWKKIKENAYSPRALLRLARKFFSAWLKPRSGK
jgi:anaerobic magnesium-protoporphyrin IX monomethyl ester cyclase